MTETKSMTASEIREHLVSKAGADETFRDLLLSNPKSTIEAELGITLPENFTIEAHEEGAQSAHLILPPKAGLNEAELQQAAGGTQAYFWHAPIDAPVNPSVDTG